MEPIFSAQNKIRQNLGLKKVKAIRNSNYKASGTKSYVYLLNRFGFQPTQPGPYYHQNKVVQRGLAPESFKKAVGGRLRHERVLVKKTGAGDQSGEVTAEDQQNDSMYICEVDIGTPAQTVKLDFDTGSADLWVFSTELSKSTQKGHAVFDPTKSSTWKELSGKAWKISYGDGSSASGDVGTDTVSIGGLKVETQAVELAKTMSTQFSQGSGDGLLGLAFGTINTVTSGGQSDPQATPVENMITQQDIPKEAELFTSAFYSERDQKSDSFYTFGYIDQDLVTASGEDIHWTDIDNSQGFWQFPSASYSVNGKSTAVKGNTAIADTGTTLALVSDDVCTALYKQIKGAKYDEQQQGWTFPTSVKAADLPDFSVAVGDKEFVIQKEDLAFAPADNNTWYGGVQSRGDMDFDILGDTFLKSVYAIWDQGNKRFGVVPKIEKTQNLTPPTTSS
ncbi:putative Eukaryotic aspartyl protease [Seiridium unicorne]|uniref:Eukaryotic aspartyl protease n=1 Tax=Seiridium unicorne TaxID=138068 RepID=A0ABR2V3J2_9PEZI